MHIKNIPSKFLRILYKKYPSIFPKNSFLDILNGIYGHDKSVKKNIPVDSNLNELPWFTYPAIEYLSQFDLKEKDVFEWGSGNSSFFFAKRVRTITSVEISIDWYNLGVQKLKSNQTLILSTHDNYANEIVIKEKKYDLIIIDGILREECANIAPNYLKEGGLIIYDNSERDPNVCKKLRDLGFIEIDFHGLGPINFYSWTTSIFFKTLNFQPLNQQPIVPKGGISEN